MHTRTLGILILGWLISSGTAAAQSSSLYHANEQRVGARVSGVQQGQNGPVWTIGRQIDAVPASTRTIERFSLIAVAEDRPRPIQVHDLITIIVSEQKVYEGSAELDTDRKWTFQAELSKWLRFYPDQRLGADQLPNGNPAIDFKHQNKYETESDTAREDSYRTRITARIIDVKPNGNIVFEARKRETHDEEEIILTLTGTCRAADITPDNTVLSTQVYDLGITEKHTGAVRDGTRRGWLPRLVDLFHPF